jgi:hypothetical protein
MKYISRFLLPLVLVTAMFLCVGQGSASAHELKEDNGISAVLHIVPDDNPKSGEDTLFYFYFSSQQPGFDLGYCKCQVSWQASDARLRSVPVTPEGNSQDNGYATLSFDEPGVYDVVVRGLAAADPSHGFELTYRVRVTPGTAAAAAAARRMAGWQIVLLSLSSLVITGVVAAEGIRRGSHYQKRA